MQIALMEGSAAIASGIQALKLGQFSELIDKAFVTCLVCIRSEAHALTLCSLAMPSTRCGTLVALHAMLSLRCV